MVKKTQEKPAISREAIAREALALLRESNLDSITMRAVAARLGVKASSLYWHFPNKAALITAMMEHCFEMSLEQTPKADTWQEWMRGFARTIWRVLDEYNDAGLLIIFADIDEPQFQRTIDRIALALQEIDMDRAEAMDLQSSLQALITGWSFFAHAKYSRHIASVIDIEKVAFRSIDALIDGWNGDRPSGSPALSQ